MNEMRGLTHSDSGSGRGGGSVAQPDAGEKEADGSVRVHRQERGAPGRHEEDYRQRLM